MKLLNDDQFKLVERLKTHGKLSIDQLTDWLKKPKTAVRRALLTLERNGYVQKELIPGNRGRPALFFRLRSQSKDLFPSKEAEVLNELIKFLIRNEHRPILEKFFKDYWEKKYTRVMETISKRKCRDLTARLEALKDVLNEDGFYARSNLTKNRNKVTLKECHCPISAASSVTNIPCQLESQLIARVLNLDCISSSPMSSQQEACEFLFQKK